MKMILKILGAALALVMAIAVMGCDSNTKSGSTGQVYRGTPDSGPVDAEWHKVLEQNGTFYEAYLRLDDLMKNGSPYQPITGIKLPKELQHATYDTNYHNKKYHYRDKDMQTYKNPADMKKVAGRYVQVQEFVYPGMGMFVGHVANGMHLVLNEDGTGTFDKYGPVDGDENASYIKPVKWNDRTITMTFPMEMGGHYSLEGNRLTVCTKMNAGIEEVYVFERESDYIANLPLTPAMVLQMGYSPSDNSFSSNSIIDGEDLGKELPGKVYRLKQWTQGGKTVPAKADDPTTNPADHFIVLVESGNRFGYGYVRNGDTEDAWFYPIAFEDKHRQNKKEISYAMLHDMFFYWDRRDNLLETWLIERPGYGTDKKYSKIEVSGKTVKWYPRGLSALDTDLCLEYELSEGEKPPVSHTSIGPVNNRKFVIPNGPKTMAGFWRLDRIQGYKDYGKIPTGEHGHKKPAEATSVEELKKIIDERFTYGEDARKLGVDLWYVLEPDGTGYMRVWDKYFELVWDDNEIYYYDISGRHLLSLGVGSFYIHRGEISIARLFKDELNPVPPRPKELGGK